MGSRIYSSNGHVDKRRSPSAGVRVTEASFAGIYFLVSTSFVRSRGERWHIGGSAVRCGVLMAVLQKQTGSRVHVRREGGIVGEEVDDKIDARAMSNENNRRGQETHWPVEEEHGAERDDR